MPGGWVHTLIYCTREDNVLCAWGKTDHHTQPLYLQTFPVMTGIAILLQCCLLAFEWTLHSSQLVPVFKLDYYTSSHQLNIAVNESKCAEKSPLHSFTLHLSQVDTNPNEVPIVGVACHRHTELLCISTSNHIRISAFLQGLLCVTGCF